MNKPELLSPSMEDYLESMYLIQKQGSAVRIKDIADSLDVKMPSVIGALKVLKQKGYIEYEKTSPLLLTDKGLNIAKSVLKRHRILADFLEHTVLLSEEEADSTACRLEHIISPETALRFEKLTEYLNRVKKENSVTSEKWKSIITGE